MSYLRTSSSSIVKTSCLLSFPTDWSPCVVNHSFERTILRFVANASSTLFLGWIVIVVTAMEMMPTSVAFVGFSHTRALKEQSSSSFHSFPTVYKKNCLAANYRAAALSATVARSLPTTTDDEKDVVSILSSTDVLDPKTGRQTKALGNSPYLATISSKIYHCRCQWQQQQA